ncbi:MAG TPA: hypothetical protein VF761_13175 [Gemmatimonadaceae bacterium]
MGAMEQAYTSAYDAISIKDVLLRAVDARMAAVARSRERLIAFSMPILEQVEQDRAEGSSSGGEQERVAARERLLDLLSDLILAELRAPRAPAPGARRSEGALPPELLARHLASTFVQVLDWWEESPSPVPAREANEYFRSLVLPVLGGQL